jgi:hypothetical protein
MLKVLTSLDPLQNHSRAVVRLVVAPQIGIEVAMGIYQLKLLRYEFFGVLVAAGAVLGLALQGR